MENIKVIIEFILVVQFISAVAIVCLFQKLKFFLDNYNTNVRNMVDYINMLNDDVNKVYNYVNEFADDFEKALEEAEKELEGEQQ